MSDGSVQLPPDSTGTRIRTIFNSGVDGGAHQEVVTFGNKNGDIVDLPFETGSWDYHGGVDGAVVCGPTERVLGIAAISRQAGASVQINGGDTVPIPIAGLSISPRGNLVGPTIVFTATDSYFVEVVT